MAEISEHVESCSSITKNIVFLLYLYYIYYICIYGHQIWQVGDLS